MPERKRDVSLHDVARLAGVGIGTASRVISGRGSVSEATRRKVEEAVSALNYRPNSLARAMRSDQSHIIAFMQPDLLNEFYDVSADVIHRACVAAGYQMVITSSLTAEEEWESFRWLADYRIDGIIHVPLSPTLPLPVTMPIVQLNRVSAHRPINAVLADERGGFDELTTYLLQQGHRDVLVIIGEEHHSSTQFRLQGVRDAVARYQDVRLRVSAGEFTREWGYQAMNVAVEELPHAVIASSPRIASGVIQALNEMELRVPEDISVVSFDDPDWFSFWGPGMTTLVPPLHDMSARAVDWLTRLIDGEEIASDIVHLPCTLRIRGSVGNR
ncbi:MAG: LacI family DNA-binding transcriptional regulator [Thermomicrobiales bacterium]|nr:LacI family DNA-binding transcriptional regulator [Thermomicrobiales bacterium]